MTGVDNEIVTEADSNGFKYQVPLILCELVSHSGNITEINAYYSNLFRSYTDDNQKVQKYLLRGFMCIIALNQASSFVKSSRYFVANLRTGSRRRGSYH